MRVELTDYDPDKAPLFVGLSVVPYVYYKEPPARPNAGKLLQPFYPLPPGPSADGQETLHTTTQLHRRRRPVTGEFGTGWEIRPHSAFVQKVTRSSILRSLFFLKELPREQRDTGTTAVGRPAINPWLSRPRWLYQLHGSAGYRDGQRRASGTSPVLVGVERRRREWVLTSYLATNEPILPITGWLCAPRPAQTLSPDCGIHDRLGPVRRREQLILFRVIQGLGGGADSSLPAGRFSSTASRPESGAQTMLGIAAPPGPSRGPARGLSHGHLQLASISA